MNAPQDRPLATDDPVLARHPYAAFLGRVGKPGRYLGGEDEQIVKPPQGLSCRFVLAFPDLYEIGMSHLGTRIIYDLINKHEDLACERAFSPWGDLEQELRARGLPLVSLESYTPLREFDVVGVSLQYELSYSNVLLNLDLGGVTLRTAERGEREPFVIAGGPTATHPEPLADFVDLFLVGEAEEVLPHLLRTIGQGRRAGQPRAEILAACGQLPGIYVPSYYEVAVDDRTGFQVVVGRSEAGRAAKAPERVGRVWVRDLDEFPFPERFPVPYAEAIFDRASIEITRGCTEGCRFCQAGMIYRPVRERSPKQVIDAVLAGVDHTGFSETSLTALSTADVSCIDPLIKELVPRLVERKAKLGVASLRAYGLSGDLLDEVKRVGISGLTFAPEAGTQRMRDVINKNVSEQDILDSAQRIFERGYDRIKLYFIMGLPTETDEDVVGIAQTGGRIHRLAKSMQLPRMPSVTCSVSQHVPKPHTPFQWAAMDSMEDLESKVWVLRAQAKIERVTLKTHDVRHSWLECLFARGDRRMGKALEHAYLHGARFDGWRECFSFERWLDALEAAEIEPAVYTRTIPVGARLPWDHIDIGLDPEFLATEYRKAVGSRTSPPCGKPVGAQVHPRTEAESLAQTQRLVCYDCGVACDMTQMRDERIVSLRVLSKMTQARMAEEAERAARPVTESIVPASRLTGRLAPSKMAADNAFKTAAEAPFSRLRVTYTKKGTIRFLGHLDLLRILPRVFRKAGIELGFSRGFNPTPRMTFGPALSLGMGAEGEMVDVDVLLPRSDEDMDGQLTEAERRTLEAQLMAKLRKAAPSGMSIVETRLCQPDELKLSRVLAAADWRVTLDPAEAAAVAEKLAERLAGPLTVVRPGKPKKRRGRAPLPGVEKTIDIHQTLLSAEATEQALRVRVRAGEQHGARIREVVAALTDVLPPDAAFTREGFLVDIDGELVPLSEAGPQCRPAQVVASVAGEGAGAEASASAH
jgi:radical SAM family uncharacterized protein/radical SAM-linked protein